jgi:hypothetical protein
MYDSFDNTYQATIGIDFLSKVDPAPDRDSIFRGANYGADYVPGGQNSTITAMGYRRPGTIQKSDSFIHSRFQRGGCGV